MWRVVMKIDCYTHVMPPKYRKAFAKYSDKVPTEERLRTRRSAIIDPDERLRVLDRNGDMAQVLSISIPALQEIVGPKPAIELARIANDEMAEWVAKYPRKYLAAIANLPLNDTDASLAEAERAIRELGFKGVQLFTPVQGKPLSSDDFMPLYELMAGFDLPIWIHPLREPDVADYPGEGVSHHHISAIFGWPYETTAAMTRLVFCGIFEKHPSIKFITHHCGGMVPFFASRIVVHYQNRLKGSGQELFPGLTKDPIDYFRMFYCDTALNGNPPGLMCGYRFFGEDHMLFGSDMPFDTQNGALDIRETVEAIDEMGISESSRKKIFAENAKTLMHL
jgi:uncharacterized protein